MMELSETELELVAVSTSIAAGCIPCTEYHISECRKLQVNADRIGKAVRLGAELADASLMHIWARFDAVFDAVAAKSPLEERGRQSCLCLVGAAVARNNVAALGQLISESRLQGINDQELMEVTGLAKRIKAKAASHLEPLIKGLDADRIIAEQAATLCE